MMVFKSEAHKSLYHRMIQLQITAKLLKRFGGIGQQECRVLNKPSCKRFIALWANDILDKLPKDFKLQEEYIRTATGNLSSTILSSDETKELLENDESLKWLVNRIKNNNDCVPKPYFPSLLRNSMIQFPFNNYDIDKSRELYGLLKFPFYRLTCDIYPEASESFTELTEPNLDNESKNYEPDENINKEMKLHEEANPNAYNYGTSNYIYAPSEMETGLNDL
ncbi:hypothetical protein BEWA_009530 [Theileria equi strain WA]|uniref:Uncharacterized protein n=1 Tax=Theileria equi strain WA TaxID=1537102 RepID=L0B350_THEEQ|nr:hypothetical protein BEWA_009530 [Theileria equi strain WA]AFZ81539.1 hypothetical protein BEWA_009530 [Theileria equi strain WA]|eukprot:XP_004831205.1 hypothetical protein BEWA_009530 [Theileria equi strain WA]